MRPVLTPAEMTAADRVTIQEGVPEHVLVARAAQAVVLVALEMLGGTYGRRVVIVAGKGNNGADGVVASRMLRARGVRVDVFELAASSDAAFLDRLDRALARADLAIDAMFGTGFRGELESAAAAVAERLRTVPTLAVDIPSGVDGATGAVGAIAVKADVTVAMAARKRGHCFEPGRSHSGRVVVADIGVAIPPGDVDVVEDADITALLPARSITAHKWDAAVLIVSGSRGMTGAPALVGRAALRSGAGMVHVAVPGVAVADALPAGELVVRVLSSTDDGTFSRESARGVLEMAGRFGAIVIGPGLGTDGRTATMVQQVVAEAPVPIVVDADALSALAGDLSPLRIRATGGLPPAVLTPHDGEYRRLLGHRPDRDRVVAARELANATRQVVLCKGPATVVASPNGEATINPTGGPALATAGTGDVLSGVIGALAARGLAPAAAAAVGAYVHGRAGEMLPVGAVAGDLIEQLPSTLAAFTDRGD